MAKEMDQLTLDCIAARKAGMTYGKWKALHYRPVVVPVVIPVVIEEPEQKEVKEHRCVICGKKIFEGHGLRKYCGEDCEYEGLKARGRAYYQRKKERMIANGKI